MSDILFCNEQQMIKRSYWLILATPMLVFGMLANESCSNLFVLPYLSYVYQKSEKGWYAASAGYILTSFFYGIRLGYMNLVLCVFFLLLVKLAEWRKQNSFGYYAPICFCVGLFISLWRYTEITDIVMMSIMSYLGTKLCFEHEEPSINNYKLNEYSMGCLFFSLALLIQKQLLYLPPTAVYGVLFLYLSRVVSLKISLYFLAVLLLNRISFDVWLSAGIFSLLFSEENRVLPLAVFMTLVLCTSFNVDHLLFVSLCGLLYLVIPFRYLAKTLVYEKHRHLINEPLKRKKELFYEQIRQFSAIFRLLASYRKKEDPNATLYLNTMSEAIEQMAVSFQNAEPKSDALYQKIIDVLTGYQYDVLFLDLLYTAEGTCQIELQLGGLNQGDETEVILPVLRVLADKQLQLVSCHKKSVFDCYHLLRFSGPLPIRVETNGYKLKSKSNISGDSYAVFRQQNATVCLLSDGMGTGEEAKRLSQTVIELFQRMIAAELSIEVSIRCINDLLQSHKEERFATLDILYFDQLKRVVYLAKSGAGPTYFYRNHALHCLNDETLPLGIVEEIAPRVYRMNCQAEDLFLLASDGIEQTVVDFWFNEYSGSDITERIEQYAMATNQYLLRDDATVVVAKVLRMN